MYGLLFRLGLVCGLSVLGYRCETVRHPVCIASRSRGRLNNWTTPIPIRRDGISGFWTATVRKIARGVPYSRWGWGLVEVPGWSQGGMNLIGKCHHLQLARTYGLVDWSQKRLNRTVRFWDERRPGRQRSLHSPTSVRHPMVKVPLARFL